MGGGVAVGTWRRCTFTGKLYKRTYRDCGRRACLEREKLLKYSHWTGNSHLPDVPENRTVIALRLALPAFGGLGIERHATCPALPIVRVASNALPLLSGTQCRRRSGGYSVNLP